MPKKKLTTQSDLAPGMLKRITLVHTLSYLPPLFQTELVVQVSKSGGRARLKARYETYTEGLVDVKYGESLFEYSVSSVAIEKAWKEIVDNGGKDLRDYDGPDPVAVQPASSVELEWEGGSNEFEGYGIFLVEPYRTIIRAIEALAERAQNKLWRFLDELRKEQVG